MKKYFIILALIAINFPLILKSQNSIFRSDFKIEVGSNSWIFHVPDDNRKSIFLAPYNPNTKFWDWSNNFVFNNRGEFTAPKAITTGYLTVNPNNNINGEGGEILLAGASGNTNILLDNYGGTFRIFDSNNERLRSRPGGHLEIRGSMAINGAELQLGLADGRSIGNIPYQRALVHHWDNMDKLVINYLGDFEGGVYVEGPHLSVAGSIYSRGHVVRSLQIPPDYVFQKYYTGSSTLKSDYKMPTLKEVEEFTKEHHHLPSIPSGKEIQEKGIDLGEMTNLLLQKIEELTLYTIEQQKQIDELKVELKKQ